MPGFIHLRVYSDYSLGYGAVKIKPLINHCVSNGVPAVAIADKDNLSASLEFALEAAKNGVQPIIGINLAVKYNEDNINHILLLAQNETGYKNLLKMSSDAYLNQEDNKFLGVTLDDLLTKNEGLLLLAAAPGSYEHKMFITSNSAASLKTIKRYYEAFQDRLYIELQRHTAASDVHYEEFILDAAYDHNIAIVATNPVCFIEKDMFEAHDALICIASGEYLLAENREKSSPDLYFKSDTEMAELFSDLPEAVENTKVIAKRCAFMPQSRAPLLPQFSENEQQELTKQAIEGLNKKIAHILDEKQRNSYFDRLEFELSVINSMKYDGYFLIVSDFIKWSKSKGVPVGPGRGSGVASVVAWSLEITDLDPLQYGLLFERFLNPDRVSMPDFDIDFCQDRRGEVIEYVKKKYGSDRVAQIATFGKMQARAVLKDVGRVMQMSYTQLNKICAMVPNNPANPVTLKEAIALDKELQNQAQEDPAIEKLLSIALKLEGTNRHSSTHAAGVVIADRPIVEIVPLYKDEVSELPAVQYSMKYAEEAGLVKFDFLGLKTLTVISWACNLIKESGNDVDISKIPLDDKKTYELLSRGETIGVFQFESAGMKEAIKKLKPDKIEDIIALGALYRPGPMDNIPSYINQKHGREKAVYLHPLMEDILKETYGLIVYQEQVMEIPRILAGYTRGEADLLRRAMGKKIKEEMEAQRDIFVNGCIKNNIEKDTAVEIFALIEKFASYGFNKAHAAAYGVISYRTAWLKANFPVEFIVASMNLEINDTDKINIFSEEAKRIGIKMLLPDINESEAKFAIQQENNIRFALGALKSISPTSIQEIIEVRNSKGKFKDIFSFLSSCNALNRKILESLVKSGALDSIYPNRRELYKNMDLLVKYASNAAKNKAVQIGLFAFDEELDTTRPKFIDYSDWGEEQKLQFEFEACGFYMSSHPLEAYKHKLDKLNLTESVNVESKATFKGTKLAVAGVITSKKIRSSKRGKYAFVQLSDCSGLLEVSIFNEELLYKHEGLLKIGALVHFKIEARRDESGARVITNEIHDLRYSLSHIQSTLEVTITDTSMAEEVKACLGTKGKVLRLRLRLPTGEEIFFGSRKQMFICPSKEGQLKRIHGIMVLET